MRHSIKRVSKSALSVILALMMVVSTMVVGIVTTSAATITSDGTMILYYDPTPASAPTWNDANANTYIYFVKEDNSGVWSNIGTKIDNDHAYVTVPKGTFKELLLVRFNPTDTGAPDWSHWGQTKNITIDNTKNYITDFGYQSTTATWSTYSGDLPTSCTVYYEVGTGMETYGSVSATVTSGSQVDYNTSVTFTATAKDGYSFGGWYSTPECSGTAVSTSNPFTKNITVDTTLYAKFSNVSEVSYVYIKDQAAWSGINAYFWNSSGQVGTGWPGDAMTKLNADGYNNESIYRIAVPDGATKLKFSKTKDNNNTQSGELDVKANQVYNNLSKNWYSFDTSANYSIVGPVDGAADDWSTTTLVSEKVDNYGTYKIDVSISNPTTQGFFRVQRDTQQYGPYNTSSSQVDFDITNTNTPATAYEASVDHYTKAFSITNAGNYSIYVRNSYHKDSNGRENRPDVWVVRTGDVSDPTVTYGVSGGNGTLEAKAGSTSISSGGTVTAGTEVTFTATPNGGYEVEGWYSDAACTEANKIFSAGTNKAYSVKVNSATTVYVKFKVSTVPSGNWYISGWIDKGEVKAPADNYKFTATATSGVFSLNYTFKNDEAGYQYITINDGTNVYHPTANDAGSDTSAGSTTDKNFNTGNKWKVPATSEQSVTFTWNANTKTLSWTDAISKPVLDTPSLSFPDGTVIAEASGSSVTLTVSNHSTISAKASDVTYHLYKDGNLYKTFTTNTYEITEAGSYTVKAVPGPSSSDNYNESAFSTAQTITKEGNLNYKYYLIGDNGNVSYEMTPSEANPKILYSSISFNSKYWFKIKRVSLTNSDEVTYSVASANNFELKPNVNDTINSWDTNNMTNSNNYVFDQSNVYYIKLDFTSSDTNPVISLSQTSDGKKSINVYTKDGTTVDGGTSPLGETVLTANSSGDLNPLTTSDKYNVYTAKSGDYLTIQTTMTDTAAANGYYVYAFCINGISYPASAKANNVYETTYKVSGDEKNDLVEITPLYFNKNTEMNNDYITVYVDASELGDHWGNTVSCYSYYYTGGANKEAYSTTGYPGQPMILSSNGLYYTRVPRFAYADGQRRTKSDGTYYTVSGITLNCFTEKELHGELYPEIGKNYQTYDYDDFKYIADLGYDTVKFEIKYRTNTSNQYTLLNKAHNHPTVSGNISKETYDNNNGWNDLLNFDGEHVDILGNKISNYDPNGSHLYVVSTGNQDVTNKGQWSTVWYVYDNDGKYITQGVPSDFIARPDGQPQTTQYTAINSNSNYKGLPVKITYESEMDATTSSAGAGGNSGVRIDGRWLYTKSTDQNVPVTVKVQYRDSDTDEWQLDANETAGTAKIDDVSTENGVATKTFTERNVNAAISATAKSGYVFVEWGTVDEDGNNYTKLPVNSSSMDFLVDKSYTIVARFAKIQEGILSISHEKYTGDGALGGGGYYLVSAVIKNSNGTEIQSFPETEEAINIALTDEMLVNKYTIDITLKTIMKGENTFVDYFRYGADGYEIITANESYIGKSGTVTQEMTVSVEDLYFGADLQVSSLQYYSDIAPVTKDAILYYKYYNRFGKERTYTKVVSLSDDYIQTNINNGKDKYFITDKLIYENAPAVEDLHKNCTWTITDQKVTRQGTTATLWGTHQDAKKQVHLSFGNLSGDGITDVDTKVTYNEYLLKDPKTDEFYRAPATGLDSENNEASFAYWIVKEKGTEKEVARCYSRDFNLRIVDHYDVTAIYSNDKENVVTISDPKFTREQFTDSSGNIKTDYLYADFIVAYMGTDNVLLNSDAGKNYHTGLIVEYGKDTKITVDPENDDKVGSTYNGTFTTYNGFTDVQIKDIATDSEKKHESITIKTVDDGSMYAAHKFVIDNSEYNNFNRLDYYVQFNNNKNIRHYIMKAYYYVYQTDANDEVIEGTYKVTEPVYFCYYNIGNSATKTETSNV